MTIYDAASTDDGQC